MGVISRPKHISVRKPKANGLLFHLLLALWKGSTSCTIMEGSKQKIIGHHVDRQSWLWINPSLYIVWARFRCSQIPQYDIGNSWIKSSSQMHIHREQGDSLTVAQKKEKKVNKMNCVAKNREGLQPQQEGGCFI